MDEQHNEYKDKVTEAIINDIDYVNKNEDGFRFLSTSFKEGYIEGMKRALIFIEYTK